MPAFQTVKPVSNTPVIAYPPTIRKKSLWPWILAGVTATFVLLLLLAVGLFIGIDSKTTSRDAGSKSPTPAPELLLTPEQSAAIHKLESTGMLELEPSKYR